MPAIAAKHVVIGRVMDAVRLKPKRVDEGARRVTRATVFRPRARMRKEVEAHGSSVTVREGVRGRRRVRRTDPASVWSRLWTGSRNRGLYSIRLQCSVPVLGPKAASGTTCTQSLPYCVRRRKSFFWISSATCTSFMSALEGIFSSIDEDGNNVLTLDELLDAMPMTGMDEQQSRDIYKQMDSNHE